MTAKVSCLFLTQVVDSMDALDKVVQEREDALRLLQTGQEKARPGAWRRDIFGRIVWYVITLTSESGDRWPLSVPLQLLSCWYIIVLM